MAKTRPQPRGLGRLVIQAGAEHGFGRGAVVDAEVFIPRPGRNVQARPKFLVQLHVGRPVSRLVHPGRVASCVQLCFATGQLVHSTSRHDQPFHTPRFSALLELVFRVKHVAQVALVVVVVVVEVLPPVPETVLGSARGEVFDIWVHRAHKLLGPCGGTVGGAVQPRIGFIPNQGVQRFSLLPIGVETKLQPFDSRLASSDVQVDARLGVGSPSVHGEGVVRHARRVDGHEFACHGILVNLRPFVAVVGEHVSAHHDVPSADALAVEEAQIALLQRAFPVLADVRALGVAVHPVLQADARQRSRIGIPRANVDDPAQSGAPVQHGTRPFDDLDLFQILEGKKAPRRPPGIATEHGEVVDEDHHP